MRKSNLWSGLSSLCVFLQIFLLTGTGFTMDFPTKPITLYISFAAGGNMDITGRFLANAAQNILDVPIVVENKPGGGSTVAAALVATKKPDGYTLAVISNQAFLQSALMLNVGYDPFKDFTLICQYGTGLNAMCVRNDSPFKTFNDLMDHARKNPGVLSYSSPGVGGNGHMFVEYLAKQARVKFKHVPFTGGAPACTALLGGHVDFTAGTGTHVKYVEQGIFRTLAVFYPDHRLPRFPDVPTLKELGYKGAPLGGWVIVGPRGLPDPIFKKLEAAFRKAANLPEFHKLLEKLEALFDFKDRSQLEAAIPADYQFYADFLPELGIEIKKKK